MFHPECFITWSVLLYVLFSERKIPPTFTKNPSEHFDETEGNLVKLEGCVSGSQPMSISWYKDNHQIFSSGNCEMSFEANVAVLCIKKSQTSDSGTYTCSASNEAGTASYDVVISITGTKYLFFVLIL